MNGVSVILEQVAFDYGTTRFRFDVAVAAGQVTAVMGPSGSGKSTLLNLIAGFAQPRTGRVLIGGTDVTGWPAHRRPVSMIFQDNNLFAHLDVDANVGLGISPSLRLAATDRVRIAAALDRTGLAGKGGRLPRELSGGERQRVALARALVRDRPVLLMDEPFGSLGPALRGEMADLSAELQRERGTTVVLVTHDPADARQISERMLFVEEGAVAASGATAAFFGKDGPQRFRDYIGRRAAEGDLRPDARKTT